MADTQEEAARGIPRLWNSGQLGCYQQLLWFTPAEAMVSSLLALLAFALLHWDPWPSVLVSWVSSCVYTLHTICCLWDDSLIKSFYMWEQEVFSQKQKHHIFSVSNPLHRTLCYCDGLCWCTETTGYTPTPPNLLCAGTWAELITLVFTILQSYDFYHKSKGN